MCLYSNNKEAADFLKKKRSQKHYSITVYKLVSKVELLDLTDKSPTKKYTLLSPCYDHEWTVGENESDYTDDITTPFSLIDSRPISARNINNTMTCFEKGIHVYINRDMPQYLIKINPGLFWTIIKLKAYLKDFLGMDKGNHEAVFTKVHLSSEEYQKAIS